MGMVQATDNPSRGAHSPPKPRPPLRHSRRPPHPHRAVGSFLPRQNGCRLGRGHHGSTLCHPSPDRRHHPSPYSASDIVHHTHRQNRATPRLYASRRHIARKTVPAHRRVRRSLGSDAHRRAHVWTPHRTRHPHRPGPHLAHTRAGRINPVCPSRPSVTQTVLRVQAHGSALPHPPSPGQPAAIMSDIAARRRFCARSGPSRPWHCTRSAALVACRKPAVPVSCSYHAASLMHDLRAATVPPSDRNLPAWFKYTGSPPTSHPQPSMPRHHAAQADDLIRGRRNCRMSLHFAICALPVGSVYALFVSHTLNLPHRT